MAKARLFLPMRLPVILQNYLHQEGTAIWMQYITAYGSLVEYGHAQPGNFVLITAASSSVGESNQQNGKITVVVS